MKRSGLQTLQPVLICIGSAPGGVGVWESLLIQFNRW